MRAETLRGHLDGMLLAVLETGPCHGYAVIAALESRSDGALDLPTGTVYPALHRLERLGLVSSDWTTVSGRKRRVYALTRSGRSALAHERASWQQFTNVVGKVLDGPAT